MTWFKCLACSFCFCASEKSSKDLNYQDYLVADRVSLNQESKLSEEREYTKLSRKQLQSINEWRKNVHQQSSTSNVIHLIPAGTDESFQDEPYNERAWKWFERKFYRDIRQDFFDSQTIYEHPECFTQLLAKKNMRKKTN